MLRINPEALVNELIDYANTTTGHYRMRYPVLKMDSKVIPKKGTGTQKQDSSCENGFNFLCFLWRMYAFAAPVPIQNSSPRREISLFVEVVEVSNEFRFQAQGNLLISQLVLAQRNFHRQKS